MRTTFPFFLARSPSGSLALWLRAVRKVCGAGGVEEEKPPQSPAALCASLHFGRGLLPSPPHTRAASRRFSPLRPRASPPLSSPSPPPRFSPAAAPLAPAPSPRRRRLASLRPRLLSPPRAPAPCAAAGSAGLASSRPRLLAAAGIAGIARLLPPLPAAAGIAGIAGHPPRYLLFCWLLSYKGRVEGERNRAGRAALRSSPRACSFGLGRSPLAPFSSGLRPLSLRAGFLSLSSRPARFLSPSPRPLFTNVNRGFSFVIQQVKSAVYKGEFAFVNSLRGGCNTAVNFQNVNS